MPFGGSILMDRALNAVEQAGYGLTIEMQCAKTCRQHCNNYEAGLKAIRSGLQTISNDCYNPNPPSVNIIIIFSLSLPFNQFQWHFIGAIHPIHVTAMMYKKQGLEGKCGCQYVNCDVTSLFRHLLYVALFKKTRLGRQAVTAWIGCIQFQALRYVT